MKISQGNPDLWQTLTFLSSHKLLASNHRWEIMTQGVAMIYRVISFTILQHGSENRKSVVVVEVDIGHDRAHT